MKASDFIKSSAVVLLYLAFAGIASSRSACPRNALNEAVGKYQAAKDAVSGVQAKAAECQKAFDDAAKRSDSFRGTDEQFEQLVSDQLDYGNTRDAVDDFCACCAAAGNPCP